MPLRRFALVLAVIAASLPHGVHQHPSDSRSREIAALLAHPFFAASHVCSEHAAGQLPPLGGDLGQDCLTVHVDSDARGEGGFPRLYHNNGGPLVPSGTGPSDKPRGRE